MTEINFKKLVNGDWGLRGPAGEVTPGARVQVLKRDGSTKTVTVGRVLDGPDGDGVAVTSIAPSRTSGTVGRGSRRCDECGRPGYLVRDLEDGGLKHRRCCDIEPPYQA